MAAASGGAIVARFFVPSPLWLAEALRVNIAMLPLGQIADALRHDRHPPLYYYLLHGRMALVGARDPPAPALSGLLSLAALPPHDLAGRRIAGPRLGWLAVAALSLSPYFLRYGSETRMYSLIIVLVLAGYLVVTAALERPRVWTSIGVALVT